VVLWPRGARIIRAGFIAHANRGKHPNSRRRAHLRRYLSREKASAPTNPGLGSLRALRKVRSALTRRWFPAKRRGIVMR